MRVVTTNTIDLTLWDQFVEHHPLGTIYHHSLWQGVIQRSYGYEPLYHLLCRDGSDIQAAISSLHVKSWLTGNRIISYPFSDTCYPLIETSEQFEALTESSRRHAILKKIITRVPKLANRMSGELLYKHFA